jgi:thiamine-monophosphate kinase
MNEFDFIEHLRAQVKRHSHSAQVVCGIGDDAAVIKPRAGRDLVVSADLLVEDIDFRRKATTPEFLGHKALAVSLSDIASMGAEPRWILLSVGVPKGVWSTEFMDRLYQGIFKLGDRYEVKLIGGDTSRTPSKILIDSMVLGDCPTGRAIFRAGARPGDLVYVTGELGGAAAGLRLLDRGATVAPEQTINSEGEAIQKVLLRQLSPEPRVGWGLVIGEEQLASAMIDISDGLSSDLHHLCEESNAGALIEAAKIPIDSSVSKLCGRRALDPLMLALHGGEDFELLFTVSPRNVAKLPKKVDGVGVTCIGTIEPAVQGIRLAEGSCVWELEKGGFQHFDRVDS